MRKIWKKVKRNFFVCDIEIEGEKITFIFFLESGPGGKREIVASIVFIFLYLFNLQTCKQQGIRTIFCGCRLGIQFLPLYQHNHRAKGLLEFQLFQVAPKSLIQTILSEAGMWQLLQEKNGRWLVQWSFPSTYEYMKTSAPCD